MRTLLTILTVLACAPVTLAATITTTGGITLYSDGASGGTVSNNLALASNGATAFSLDELSGFGHLTSKANDGVYGNANSWIGAGGTGTSGPYIGIDLGSSVNINSIAFGRDNTLGFFDRSTGTYTLQTRNDGSVADNAAWVTVGTINYSASVGPPDTLSTIRHQYNFAAVDATAVRLLVPSTGIGFGTAIDEIELYSGNPTPVGLTLSQNGPATIPASVPDNLALASNGATAFAKDLINAGGFAAHQTAHLNDGVYGNANSWIGDTDGTFAGVDLGGEFVIDSIAFGRDNTGQFADRVLGNITVQYTDVANPDENTASSDWITLDVLTFDGASPALRHEFDLDGLVTATGIRLITADGGLAGGMAIDELEVFGTAPVVPEPASIMIWSLLGLIGSVFGLRRVRSQR